MYFCQLALENFFIIHESGVAINNYLYKLLQEIKFYLQA